MTTRTRAIAALALAACCLAAGVTIVAADNDVARGDPDIEAYAPETAFVPGEEATLSITLNNRGDLEDQGLDSLESDVLTAHETTMRILPADEADGVDAVPFDVRTDEQAIGDVPRGSAGPFDFTVVPDEDAEPGVYRVPVELEYRNVYRAEQDEGDTDEPTATVRDSRIETETVYVDVAITDRARFAVVDVDGAVQAGASGTVDVTMRNVANESAREASVTASPVDPDLTFTTGADSTETYVDEWAPGENRTFTYRLDAAEEATRRPSTFELTVEYRDAERADATARTVRTGVTPMAEQAFSARGLNSSLRVGEDGRFEVELTNEGPRDLDGVVAVFGDAAAADGDGGGGATTVPEIAGGTGEPSSSDPNVVPRETRATVGTLAAGESTTVAFEAGIRTDATPGNRTLQVAARYRAADGEVVTSDPLDAVVDVASEEDVFAVEPASPATVPENSTPGRTVRYDVVVRNVGSEPVSDVQAKLFADSPLDATGDEAFVTDLDPGEETTVSFEVSIDGGATPKRYATSVDFRYQDADGDDELSDSYRLPFDVVESDSDGVLASLASPTGAAAGLGVVAVAGALVWGRGRIAALLGRLRRRLGRRLG